MPITISHAATAIPLRRFRLPLSALIMGTIVPDFEFFLRLSDHRVFAHTLPGLLLFCVPMGLFGLLVFHKLLKFPLLSLLPFSHRMRLYQPALSFSFLPIPRFLSIIAAILLGAFSHVLWDAWTHDGWMVTLFPFLGEPVFYAIGKWFKVYDIIAQASSVFGIVAVIVAYRRWYRKYPIEEVPKTATNVPVSVRILAGVSMLSMSAVAGVTYATFHRPVDPLKPLISLSMVSMVSAFLVLWLLFSILWHMVRPTENTVT